MTVDVSKLVSKALSLGYQVEPRVFDLLENAGDDFDADALIGRVVQKKSSEGGNKTITERDIVEFLPAEALGRSVDESPLIAEEPQLEVLFDPTNRIAPLDARDGFMRLFEDRYRRLVEIAKRRPDLKQVMDSRSVGRAKQRETSRVMGLLVSRRSKKGDVELTLDDPAGSVNVVCNGEEISKTAMKLPLDALILAEVSKGRNGQLYARSINLPDIPERRPVTSVKRVYAVLLSDLHIGSKMFLQADFGRFLAWLNGRLGDLDIVNRIKYVVIAGDVIDGVGVYPGQELQLIERNLLKQFQLAGQLIEQIPRHIQIVISPGNHDPVRQALPQPAVPADLAEPLYKMDNIRLVGNPAYLKLHGVSFLVYHGRSLDDIIATTPDLSYRRPAMAMEVLLKARHLAPTYGKRTALSPEANDMLVIDPVPDVFQSGHIHSIDTVNYRGTLIINCGTWQSQTPFQANMGLEPTPSIVPILNLATLEIVKRNFTKEGFGVVS
jgi:DNA polymerase II small subunit